MLVFVALAAGVAQAQAQAPAPASASAKAQAQNPAPAKPQDPTSPVWFEGLVQEWDRVLVDAQTYFADFDANPAEAANKRTLVGGVREQAVRMKTAATEELNSSQQFLDALGPPPAEGEPAEDAGVQEKRAQYTKAIADLKSRIAQSDLAIARVDKILASVSSQARDQLVKETLQRWPVPVLPSVLIKAGLEILALLRDLADVPRAWYMGLDDEGREAVLFWPPLLVILVLVVLAVVGRRLLLARLGPDPAQVEPTYARRLVAATAVGVARGILPGAFLIGALVWINRPGAVVSGDMLVLSSRVLFALFVFILATALPRAILAPEWPAWRLTDLPPGSTRLISGRVTFLATVIAIDLLLIGIGQIRTTSLEVDSVVTAAMTILEAVGVFLLVRPSLWEPDAADDGDDEAAPDPEKPRHMKFWTVVRNLTSLLAVVSIGAALIGYVPLGRFLIESTIGTAFIGFMLLLVRGLLRELVGVAARSRFLRERLGIRMKTLKRLRFWIRGALDPVLAVAALFLIGPLWGLPADDLTRWATAALSGFTIGNVTISLSDILLAILVFLVAMAVARLIQRTLLEKVLPATKMELSVQHSLSAGVGYAGVIIAVALAIAVAGVDLTNVALVAGALSVGIGFGLQNVVNNFVSGFILLVERPIKVGDWVVLGSNEGLVKKVSFRATEVETWQKASLIIPNAEILSNPLTNWTLKDRYGRIEVAIGVAYGSDTEQVRDILLACARAQPRVMTFPAPNVLFLDFGDSALLFELRCFTSDVMSRLAISSDIRFDIDRRFREAGIEIPFPQRVVHMVPPTADAPPPPPEGQNQNGQTP
ncbi:MAG: mechanosensitive ion channel family protein [Rhodobacterales bacterium]|nr:mechanosensitive ion channel family protein [Rhodobacterales bacterium]